MFWRRLEPLFCLIARMGLLSLSVWLKDSDGLEVTASLVIFSTQAERLYPLLFDGPNQPAYWRNILLGVNPPKSPSKQPESGLNPSRLAPILQPNTRTTRRHQPPLHWHNLTQILLLDTVVPYTTTELHRFIRLDFSNAVKH